MRPGDNISHFEIQDKLGDGGMGVVYTARDLKLDRTVALKFLPGHLSRDPDAKERFVVEAKAASALDHPNICTVFEIGETDDDQLFIAMAYYEGQTLKYRIEEESFSVDQVCDIGAQLARAVERAHEAGIVHRDIKPANVMVTDRGAVKLLDFGLAKLATGLDLTKSGSTVGTASYMSPEQYRGEEAGPAADVWSIGVVLYEMFTGRKPFAGSYEQAIMYATLNEEPDPVQDLATDIHSEVADLVMRCLAKSAAERPTISEVAGILETHAGRVSRVSASSVSEPTSVNKNKRLAGLAAAGILIVAALSWVLLSRNTGPSPDASLDRSIAVLPFSTVQTDEASRAFVAGIHDDILSQLAKISGLKVISRTSVMQFERSTIPIKEIGTALGVATILEGTVQRAGDRIRMTVRLINAASDENVWSETYDKVLSMDNIFGIQSDLAKSIAGHLRTELTPDEEERIGAKSTESLAAYELLNLAKFHRSKRTPEGARRARELTQEALALDSTFAPAYGMLASLLGQRAIDGELDADSIRGEELQLVMKAIELAPDNASSHTALGMMRAVSMNDLPAARASLERAIELEPSSGGALSNLGTFVLARQGHYDEALAVLRKAKTLDPKQAAIQSNINWVLYLKEDYGGCVAEAAELTRVSNTAHGWRYHGRCLAMRGEYVEAIASGEKAIELDDAPINKGNLALIQSIAGNVDEALEIAKSVETCGACALDLAILYARQGDLDHALEFVESGDDFWIGMLAIDPAVPAELRQHPAVIARLRRLGLVF